MKLDKFLNEGKNWKNDPWGARQELVDRAEKALRDVSDYISPSESLFFYERKNSKTGKDHQKQIGMQLKELEKGVVALEKAIKMGKG